MRRPAVLRIALFTFLTIITMSGTAQTIKNYEKEWKKVDELINKKNLPKSALAEVKKIYELAKKEKQDAQVIKALVMMTELQSETREDNEVLGVKEMETEISKATQPSKSVLQSLLARQYWEYYQNNRWRFYDRSETKEFKKDDVATWSAGDFHKTITELYLASLKESKLLKTVSLERYDAIILKGNTRSLRPTLFDLLAHRALSYFTNNERDLDKPAYAFEINQPEAFSAPADFVKTKFITNDAASLYHKALLLYQELIAFHLNDAKPDALIDVDIDRLGFVNQNGVMNNKEELYLQALERITKKYPELPAAAQAWYLIASHYENKAAGYQPGKEETHRYDRLKAKEICEAVIKEKTESEGWVNCYNLLSSINRKELQFSVEKVNVPNLPFRSLVHYRDITTLYLRLVKADEKMRKELENNYYDENAWAKILAASPVRNWQQVLPDTRDLQKHSTEIKVDGLPVGEYILIASNAADPKDKKAVIGARYFYVSNISFVNSDMNFFALNRDNGQPLANAAVQVWLQKYDYKTYKYYVEKGKTYKADANGFFKVDRPGTSENRYASYQLDISHGSDRLFINEYLSSYYYENVERETRPQVFFFTDRSIYRPGQTVYFKGIVISKDKEKLNRIRAGFKSTVVLYDANGEQKDTLHITTNEFGSFSGKLQLPQNLLNGEFRIDLAGDADGQSSFSVEEYKRPKFYVEYEPIKGTYKVNEKIKVTGLAKAFAGNNVDGASVKYRVVRNPRFLYPWLFWRWYQPPSEEMEIVHGELKTDKDGKFTVEFEAIPDLKVEKKFDPVFDYTVYADVTDINGETRSGETTVSVSYKSLQLRLAIGEKLPADSLNKLSIYSSNLMGEHQKTTVQVKISKLKAEDRLIRERFWEQPDQFVMSKEEYLKNFPYDEYKDETDLHTWPVGETAYNGSDTTSKNGEWKISNTKFSPGFYMVEAIAKDKDGNEVKDVQYIELYNPASKQLNKKQYLWTSGPQKPIEPGEKTNVQLGTSADNLFVIRQVNKQKENDSWLQLPELSFTKLNNEISSQEFSATEADRGGYGLGYFFVKHNRFFQYNDQVTIPWSNKELQIEYATFRDKTLPGSEEKWKVKIKGLKSEKVAAEMLASMYDASLDEFRSHYWSQPYIWPGYSNYNRNWNGQYNFSKVEAQQKYNDYEPGKYFEKTYDDFFSTAYDLGDVRLRDRKAGNPRLMKMAAPEMAKEEAGAPPPPPPAGAPADLLKVTSGLVVSQDGYVAFADSTKITFNFSTQTGGPKTNEEPVKVRKNFNETAFFFPDLRTNENGEIEFSVTMPESLTKWKLQTLAHTKELAFGTNTQTLVTQKDLMVQPNTPRFLREGDRMEFSAKIVNLTDKEITGTAQLELFDATTNQPVDGWFKNMMPNQFFTIAAGQSEAVKFPVEIPYLFNKALTWRIVAKAGTNSDGEEASLPVLTNRMLVTETMPLPMRGVGTKNFSFDKLKNNQSETLQHFALTVEYTSNPAWYAVQALPYLMEYPYECAEQTWNRYYANSIATMVANSSPKIKAVFDKWNTKDTAALLSNLQKNQELKALLLEETPWVLEAKTEAQQKKNLALLFDLLRMSKELNSAMDKLQPLQSSNGGFVWFNGGPDDRYITQYIITGIGHLRKIKAFAKGQDDRLMDIVNKAIPYLDAQIKKDYDNLLKYKTDLKKYVPGYTEVQYLYMRSFFTEYKIAPASQKAYDYFRTQSVKMWNKESKYMQGMIALALHRTGDKVTPAAIIKSLQETSINNEELGMYWKDFSTGRSWFWFDAPIESHALLVEAFQEIKGDKKVVDDLRTWLIKNKQTNNWKTTKATAEACYAFLLNGTEWLSSEPVVEVKLGSMSVKSTDQPTEAGTGYFKKTIDGAFVKPEMGNIAVTVSSPTPDKTGVSWGGVYWQYFEDLDKITSAETPLKLNKKLFVETNTDRGPVITPVKDGDVLKVGNKIKVRVELRVDRDMEYVHMKDMRASCMEPVNVLSSYKWQGGLGYYETTKDASTNFFFDHLNKGTYVFEYTLFVTHAGNFSNGITTIQCMYAPEFTSHSEGIRVAVE